MKKETGETVIVHIVTARVFAMDNVKDFEINVIKKEARETASSYLWEDRRLAKGKLLAVASHQDGDRLIGFRTYCLEPDVEKAKEAVVNELKKQVSIRYEAITTMQRLLEGEATLKVREVEREED